MEISQTHSHVYVTDSDQDYPTLTQIGVSYCDANLINFSDLSNLIIIPIILISIVIGTDVTDGIYARYRISWLI